MKPHFSGTHHFLAAAFCLVVARVEVQAQQLPWSTANNIADFPRAELDAITARGRLLAAYDFAAWNATDAVFASSVRDGLIEAYLARPMEGGKWEVVFGKLNSKADTFHIAFRAVQRAAGETAFTTYEMRPPSGDVGYFARAGRALYTCRIDFRGLQRPYNAMVVPVAGSNEWFVYIVPAPTVAGVWPHGGDERFRVSADGRTIIERRRMHVGILDVRVPGRAPDGAEVAFLTHTAVLDNRPEDTDVFHVLTRTPRLPEIVVSDKYYFSIDTTGRIMAYNRDTTIKR